MQKYIDAQCHLLDALDPDLAISNAQKKGVTAFVCAPATPTQWDDVVGLVNKFDCVFGVIGVHPWNVSELPQNCIDKLEKLLIKNGFCDIYKEEFELRTENSIPVKSMIFKAFGVKNG